MRRFKTNILIRDKRLEQMQQNGLKIKYEVLSDKAYLHELKLKLIEEANECLQANSTTNDLAHELADVLEVVDYIIKQANIDKNELLEYKKQKHEKLGGFDQRIKTLYVDIEDDNTSELNYYLNFPNKYPELKE